MDVSDISIHITRPIARLILANAFRAALAYDGREDSYVRLETSITAFEQLAKREALGGARDEMEAMLAAKLRRNGRPITVQGLLNLAIARLAKRLAEDRAPIATIETGFNFLPADGIAPVKRGSGNGFTEHPGIERTKALIAALIENGIFIDDMVSYTGVLAVGQMRKAAYTLIQIPCYNREILICDQVGEATFVGHGLRGPIFWASYRKDELAQFSDIVPVINRESATNKIVSLILSNNLPVPKIKILRPQNFPLTTDIILHHALAYAKTHKGKLPTEYSGEVDGLPGQSWKNWNHSLRRNEKLGLEGIKGLSHLFQLYGLKRGYKEDPEAIDAALGRVEATGAHGLMLQHEFRWSEDLILRHALLYAAKRDDRKLPVTTSGAIEGLHGQTWRNGHNSIRDCSNGLTRKNIRGLAHLFELYGLKRSRNEDPEVVAGAIERLKTTGEHGLVVQKEFRLSEDLILRHALLYAARHKEGKLPTSNSGDIEGLPGQNWNLWGQAIRKHNYGLTRENVKGLSHFFELYGLKIEQKENPEEVAAAIKRLETIGEHGLVVQEEEFHFSEDVILRHALLYAAKHKEGKLPTNLSGTVDGLPGQTWKNWHQKLYRGKEVKGLSDFFNLLGLKQGNKEVPASIAAAQEILYANDNQPADFSLVATLKRRVGRRYNSPVVG